MRNSKKGFTIIEMVIVIAIIGILASVLIPTYGNVVANANESAALQTARSVMTNWLASSTSSGGVPTTGPDAYGNTQYAAYFGITNDNGQSYQFRYAAGGIERSDNDVSKYLDFDPETNSNVAKLTGVYLTTPFSDSNFDATTYAVNIYRVTKQAAKAANGVEQGGNYFVYYLEYPSGKPTDSSELKYAYDFGGADVYACIGDGKDFKFFTCANTNNIPDDATWFVADDGVVRSSTTDVTFVPGSLLTAFNGTTNTDSQQTGNDQG